MKNLNYCVNSATNLSHVALFNGVPNTELVEALEGCRIIKLEHNDVTPRSRAGDSLLYAVIDGEITQESNHQAQSVLTGGSLGAVDVFYGEYQPTSFRSNGESTVLLIDPDRFWKLVDISTQFSKNLLALEDFREKAKHKQAARKSKMELTNRAIASTVLTNREAFTEQLSLSVSRAHTLQLPLSLIVINFSEITEEEILHEENTGNEIIKVAEHVLHKLLRSDDFFSPVTRNMLIAILADTPRHSALKVAQRIRDHLESTVVFGDMRMPLPHISASVSVKALYQHQSANELIATCGFSFQLHSQAS